MNLKFLLAFTSTVVSECINYNAGIKVIPNDGKYDVISSCTSIYNFQDICCYDHGSKDYHFCKVGNIEVRIFFNKDLSFPPGTKHEDDNPARTDLIRNVVFRRNGQWQETYPRFLSAKKGWATRLVYNGDVCFK